MFFDYEHYLNSLTPYYYLGIAVIILSIFVFEFEKRKNAALVFLVVGNLIMSIAFSYMQPFLHMWDEQIHALVAKNLMNHPFQPMLFVKTHIKYSYKIWVGNHIWLHKQPWFLWQIALSFKIFGVGIFSLRLPSILMFSVLLILIYRIGSLIDDKSAGYYAALMFAGSNFFMQLVTGARATDHNDVAFVFYVTASLWAWFEYNTKGKKHFLFLIGLFSGIAILNKWLPGLLVYSGWFLTIIFSKTKWNDRKYYFEMLQSLIVTVIVALPWQLYILWRFPLESRYEYALNSEHFFNAIEKHRGSWMFHIDHISTLYGAYFRYLIYAALIFLIFHKIKKDSKIALLTWILLVYAFYTLVATKMLAFTFIVAPLIFIAVSMFISFIIFWVGKRYNFKTAKYNIIKPATYIVIFSIIFLHFLSVDMLTLKDDKSKQQFYSQEISNTLLFKKLPDILGKGNYEFFNCRNLDHIKVMFYTSYNAHGFLPTKNIIKTLLKQNIIPVVFDNGKLPKFIVNNREVIKIKSSEWQNKYLSNPKIYR